VGTFVETFLEARKFRVLPVTFIHCDPDLLQSRMLILHGCLAKSAWELAAEPAFYDSAILG
jgi:hypothetical protein